MSMYKAELRRLAKRRFTRFMLLFVLLALAAITVSFAFASHKIGPTEQAAAVAEAQRQEQEQVRWAEQERESCEQDKAAGRTSDRYPPGFECSQITGPPPGTMDPQWFLPYEFNFRGEFAIFISIFAGILALFAYIVGASYVGAEWSTGGMMNLLLWRPKRLTVLLTKLGALLTGLLAVGLSLGALWTVTFWLIAKFKGNPEKMTQGVWESFALSGARGVGLVLAVGVVGFGLASLGRHTAMALGAAVAAAVISEIGLRIALAVAGVKFPDRFVLSTYALAWFEKEWKLADWDSCNFVQGECRLKEMVITWHDSALVFGIGLAVVLVAAMWTMQRRDIT